MGEWNRAWQRKGMNKGKKKRGGQLNARQHAFGSSRKKGKPDTADYCNHEEKGTNSEVLGFSFHGKINKVGCLVPHCPSFIICSTDAWICLKEYRIYVRINFTAV